jgi:hypothetical protein
MHILEKRRLARDAGERKTTSLLIAGGAGYGTVLSAAGLIFASNAHRFPAGLSNK